jgi:hypothetical protein
MMRSWVRIPPGRLNSSGSSAVRAYVTFIANSPTSISRVVYIRVPYFWEINSTLIDYSPAFVICEWCRIGLLRLVARFASGKPFKSAMPNSLIPSL